MSSHTFEFKHHCAMKSAPMRYNTIWLLQGEADKFEAQHEPLTFGDLRKSIATVGMEAANSELRLFISITVRMGQWNM